MVAFLSKVWLLTIENNNVKFAVAERLVPVGDAGPETARPPQRQPQQNLALVLVEGNRLTVKLIHAIVIYSAQLGGMGKAKLIPAQRCGNKKKKKNSSLL